MLTDEEAKKYASKLLEWCEDRSSYYGGCVRCPFRTNETVDCIGLSLDNLEEPLITNG